MDHSTDLTLALRQLLSLIDLGPEQLSEPLDAFTLHAIRAVASYRGVRVVLVEHGHEVVLTSFVEGTDPSSVRTTVTVPLVVLVPDLGWSSSLVLYAAAPGAFVDLAADLAYVLRIPLRTRHQSVGPAPSAPRPGATQGNGPVHGPVELAVVVDGDPLPTSTASTLHGLEERTSIDRAVGVLLGRGDTPEEAVVRLQQRAAGRDESLALTSRDVLREAAGRP